MKMFLSVLWVGSVIFAVVIGFAWGQQSKSDESKKVLAANAPQVSVTISPSPQITSAISNTTPVPNAPIVVPPPCSKNGFAQKWEYLTPYVIKPNDTVQAIAKEQLHDETRVNEILKLNGIGLVVGAMLYLPPSTITKSSGNIKQVYGKLVEKNSSSWHVNFSSDAKGQGVLFPAFLFDGVPNKDTYKIGDCIKVLFDDGFKVYSVALQ